MANTKPELRSKADKRVIEYVSTSSLTPYARNSRTHSPQQVKQIAASIKEFGFTNPILIDESNGIIAGHGRVMAAEHLQLAEVPCIRLEYLTETQKRAYVIADNKLALNAGWDEELLNIELTDLHEDGFDVGMIGFEADELSDLMGYNDKEVVEDEVPEPPGDPITKPGDLWVLGEHRLLCGDSTKAEDVERLMAGTSADAVVTDPPYGIGFSYDTHNDDREAWFQLMNNVVPMLRSMARFVVMPSCGIDRIGWWYKHHEPDWMMCWYKGSPGHLSKVGFNDWEAHLVWGRPPKQIHDYWQTKCGFHVDGHPCPKPVEYSAWLVERAVERGGLIYEPFCGSGTTLIAAEQLGRKCYGMEISPAYCDVIVKRWETLTGKKAVLDNA